jgi:hypothetical protein
VLKAVQEDRKHRIQATIVRIMKVRKVHLLKYRSVLYLAHLPFVQSMKHMALIAEVIAQISERFTPKIAEIEDAIEILLQKDYMERLEGQRDVSAIRLAFDVVLRIGSVDLRIPSMSDYYVACGSCLRCTCLLLLLKDNSENPLCFLTSCLTYL